MSRATSKHRLGFEPLEGRRLLAAVNIPTDLNVAPAAVVATPVNIDVATGVRGAEIRLTYDTSLLDLNTNAVTVGSVWAGANTQVTANVDDATGTVVIFVSSPEAALSTSGSLVVLGFTAASGAVIGSTAIIDLTQVVLNEGEIPVSPTPILGPDATDGRITIIANGGVGADRIAGFVYADTNNNLTPEPVEGIPGVLITLINQGTQEQREVTTGADGSYEFLNVPAGSYVIRQQHPIAYIDGGSNELTRQLVAGQPLTDQNFREIGLRAKYLYTRLLSTPLQPVGSVPWTNLIAQINVDARTGTVASPTASVASASSVASVTNVAVQSDSSMPAIFTASTPIVTPMMSLEDDQASPVVTTLAIASPLIANGEQKSKTELMDEALAESSLW